MRPSTGTVQSSHDEKVEMGKPNYYALLVYAASLAMEQKFSFSEENS